MKGRGGGKGDGEKGIVRSREKATRRSSRQEEKLVLEKLVCREKKSGASGRGAVGVKDAGNPRENPETI